MPVRADLRLARSPLGGVTRCLKGEGWTSPDGVDTSLSRLQRLVGQKLWDQEERTLEQRRHRLESMALAITKALKTRWPAIDGIWQFGSSLGPGFQRDSDLDLAIGGLPAADLLDSIAVAEGTIVQRVAAGHVTPVAVDLVRLETLPPHWRENASRGVPRGKLDTLVESLADLRRDWASEGASRERVDAAALRLQSL